MRIAPPVVLGVALLQGMALHVLHRVADSGQGPWSELLFLLPAYAFTLGVPLTAYLLHAQLPVRVLAVRLAAVGLALAATAAYTGWTNGPVAGLRPDSSGSVFLYGWLALLAWFVAMPFLRLGVRGSFSLGGYAALFDEAWRLAITVAFATLFVGVFWGLLSLFVTLFESLGIRWPREMVFRPAFYYPATCTAASFAIGLTDVKPEMFHALRHLLLGVLRWLTVLAAAIVLFFLGAILVEGVDVLWKTRFATAALISLSLVLITLYNAVYQDSSGRERLPLALTWLVRAALVAGPLLAAIAFWALTLRLRQYGVSEDRLYALLVVSILAGYLLGYCVVALRGGKAPFEIRHVNVVMALVMVTTLIAVHSPALDFKRIAVRSQVARLARDGDRFDFRYLRHDAGHYGIVALQALARAGAPRVGEGARSALAEANRTEYGLFARDQPSDPTRVRARMEVYPRGRLLPEGFAEHLIGVYERNRRQLWCIDRGLPCAVLLIDLDGDRQEEAVVLSNGDATAYARLASGWVRVGRLIPGRYQNPDELRRALAENRWRTGSPARYLGLEIDASTYAFVPDACAVGESHCP